MRRMWLLFLLTVSLTGMSGCDAKNIETQAYAVSMGIDRLGEAGISVSVQIPTLSQGGTGAPDGSGGDGGGKGYTFSTADGRTLTEALEMLHASTPRALNLTGVKTIVVSEELASSEAFERVLQEMATAYRVYGAAEVVVCRGEAKEFIKEQKTVIGFRLSESVTVALEHYQEIGCIPHARAADVYYLSRSIYADPVAVYAAVRSDEEEKVPGGVMGDVYAGMLPGSGDDKNQYFGTALFRKGRMVGKLTGMQTQLLNMLTGRLDDFSWIIGGAPVRILVSGRPQVSVDLSGSVPVVSVSISLDMMNAENRADPEAFEQEMLERLGEMTEYCMKLGADPFGFAERAVGKFLTVQDWQDYDWPARIRNARVLYDVKVKKAEL